tara:strand:- start:1539 stop:2531 length:993 start_codon:yes stop_codon:yes gene_type:complete
MDKGLVAITGATGFLGSQLTHYFIENGYRVRAHAHTVEHVSKIDTRVESTVIGEITDKDMIKNLVNGADYVVHTVSNFRVASGKPESYQRINVGGTQTVLDAAMAAGVKRFVHCSTIGVHGDVKQTPANEMSDFAPGDLYQETKLAAEQYVLSKVGKSKTEIVAIRPCSMYGPGDMRMLKMFKMLAKGRFFFVGECKDNFHAVYIDDVVEGFANALITPNIDGEVFLVGGPDGYRSLRDYVGVVAKSLSVDAPKITFPYWLFWYAAILCEIVCAPFGIDPVLHRRRVRFFKNNRAFDTEKSIKVLGLKPQVNLEEGMRKTAGWYKENNLL